LRGQPRPRTPGVSCVPSAPVLLPIRPNVHSLFSFPGLTPRLPRPIQSWVVGRRCRAAQIFFSPILFPTEGIQPAQIKGRRTPLPNFRRALSRKEEWAAQKHRPTTKDWRIPFSGIFPLTIRAYMLIFHA
jgi:hypothetical protein